MSLKNKLKSLVAAIEQLPIISAILHQKSVRRLLEHLPGLGLLYPNGWNRIHPFDRLHGTDTSGVCAATDLPTHETARTYAFDYAGSQPNVLRLALAKLPQVDDFTFIDLGCGKGRALLVASEFS